MELRHYLAILRRRILLVVLSVLVAGGVAYGRTDRTAEYSASSTIYVGIRAVEVTEDRPGGSTDVLQSIERLILTFSTMIDSTPTAQSAISRTGLERSPENVVDITTALPLPATQLLEITVKDPDPVAAQLLANGMAEAFVENVRQFEPTDQPAEGEIPSLPAYVFERAELPTVPTRPPLVRNIIVAAMFGLFVSAGLSFLFEYLDITVKAAGDAERRLRLPVLGVIPIGLDEPGRVTTRGLVVAREGGVG